MHKQALASIQTIRGNGQILDDMDQNGEHWDEIFFTHLKPPGIQILFNGLIYSIRYICFTNFDRRTEGCQKGY